MVKFDSYFEHIAANEILFFYFLPSLFLVSLFLFSLDILLKKKTLKVIAYIFISLINGALYGYFRKTNIIFDPLILIDNSSLINNKNSLSLLLLFFDKKMVIQSIQFPIMILIVSFFYKDKRRFNSKVIGPVGMLLTLSLSYLHPNINYPIFNFVLDSVKKEINYQIQEKNFSIIKEFEKSNILEIKNKYNIIVILLESFNGTYIGEKLKNGKEITPVMNQLYKNNFSIKNYFSNSVQTIKGQFSILCGLLPLSKGKASYLLDSSKMSCLPQKLKKFGYKSLFYNSFVDDNFDNTKFFISRMGFDFFESPISLGIEKSLIEKETIGWGINDGFSYRIFFDKIKKMINEKNENIFAVMTTVTNHMPFILPEKYNFLISTPKNRQEHYLNSIHLSDKYLGDLIKEFEASNMANNSILVITSDHSFPNGRKNSLFNEKGATEDNFKVPFLLLAPAKVRKELEDNKLGQYNSDHSSFINFLNFILSNNQTSKHAITNRKQPIVLIQPYDGGKIKLIKDEEKFVWSVRSKILEKGILDNDLSDYKKVNIEDFPEIKSYITNYNIYESSIRSKYSF